jgi:MFS family permease
LTYRQLLKFSPDFRRLWIGQIVSEIGDWLNNIAVLALTIQTAGIGSQGLAISIYAVARHLPLFIFGPIAGVFVDRLDRRRVMIGADLSRAAVALAFLLTAVYPALPVIYISGAVLFSVSAFFNAAKRASLPNLVKGGEQLLAANSLSASTTAATIAVGSALGGIVATVLGRETVFVLNCATFLVSAEMIRRIKSPTQQPRDNTQDQLDKYPLKDNRRLYRVFQDFTGGLHYVKNVRVLAAIFIVGAGWGLGNGAARALYSIFGARFGILAASGFVARPTDFGISVLFIAMGIGGLIGAPIAKRFNSAGGGTLGNRLGRSLFFDGCGLVMFSFMPGLASAAMVLSVREANFAIWWTAQQTLIMRNTEDRFAGRVFASFETVTTLTMVGSILAAGFSADRFGIRPVAAVGGATIIVSGILWFILNRRINRSF